MTLDECETGRPYIRWWFVSWWNTHIRVMLELMMSWGTPWSTDKEIGCLCATTMLSPANIKACGLWAWSLGNRFVTWLGVNFGNRTLSVTEENLGLPSSALILGQIRNLFHEPKEFHNLYWTMYQVVCIVTTRLGVRVTLALCGLLTFWRGISCS